MAHDIEFFKAKTTLAPTALAAALALVLGLMSAPATAHDCSLHKNDTHKHCDGDTGGGGGGGGGKDALPEPIIVFEATFNGNPNDHLGVVDLDGNFAIILKSELYWARNPSWMPNGRDIVFVSDWNATLGIYRLQVVDDSDDLITDGVPELVLAAPISSFTTFPVVTDLGELDGLLLAYSASVPHPGQPGGQNDIFLARLNADGTATAPVNITNTPDVSELYSTLSPDGLSIAYSTRDVISGERDIVVADIGLDAAGNPDAGPETSLVLDVFLSPLKDANEIQQLTFRGLDYSNTTNEIALNFTSGSGTEDSDQNIWILPVDTPASAHRLADTPEFPDIKIGDPSWSPDDSQLVYLQLDGPKCAHKKGRGGWSFVIRNFEGEPIDGCPMKRILDFGDDPDWRP